MAEGGTVDDTSDVGEEDTVIAEEVPPSGEDLRPRRAGAARKRVARREAATGVSAKRTCQANCGSAAGARERLATLVEAGGQVGCDGQMLVSIDEAIRAVAESLPGSVRLAQRDVARPEHPGGESFFSGRSAEEITDQQAEEIARGQLARSGLLRGQRVRVAD